MNRFVLLDKFDRQVRANPVVTPGMELIDSDDVLRLQGAYNFVCQWQQAAGDTRALVKNQADHFKRLGQTLMWRVYEHDGPGDLAEHLLSQGFKAAPQGTLMISALIDDKSEEIQRDIQLVSNKQQLKDYYAVAKAVFEGEDIGPYEYFESLLDHPDFSFFCGYWHGKPVAASLLQIQPNSEFGLLFGGSVLADYRGKGFYRSMINKRKQHAQQLGLGYLTTEARETSRPVLASLGFKPLVKETTWILA